MCRGYLRGIGVVAGSMLMLSLPDFKEKQLLFIQTERGVSNKIKFYNDNIVFTKDDAVINRASCHKVFCVFVIGDIAITSELMKNGLKYGVSFFFLKQNMEVYASVNAAAEANYLLRQEQYTMPAEKECNISRALVKNKIENQQQLLDSIKERETAARLRECMQLIEAARDNESLLGLEGNASRLFFGSYFSSMGWRRRMPRVKPDIPNFLLDIGYTLLFNCVDSLLRLYGFDTYKGCYHKLFFQRKSLSCDVVEPFRCIIDKQLRKSFNLGQVDKKDFSVRSGKVVAMNFAVSRKYSEIFMQTIMDHKEELYHFVQSFYRHVMNAQRNPFPSFRIK